MPEESLSHRQRLPVWAIQQIDRTCDIFESAWKSGQRPRIEQYLPQASEVARSLLFEHLLLLDLEYRAREGDTPAPEEYSSRFPGYADAIQPLFSKFAAARELPETIDRPLSSKENAPARPVEGEEGGSVGQPVRFGRFEGLVRVGQGTFGRVYRARDPLLDRDVALKTPRPGVLEEGADVVGFLREARAAAELRHPHIVPIHEAGKIDGTPYIASAFIEGHTLRQRLRGSERLGHRGAASLVAKLAAALHYAHTKGVVHRDVKPENVMLDRQGEPQIMDFGLARRRQAGVLRTREGVLMGTPAYMSPEQAGGLSHLADGRSDLWSLGVVLYELLTGQRPFLGAELELLAAIQTKEPQPPRKHAPSIPKDLETICLRCLQKAPASRYASCQELADELQRWLAGEPIRARPIGAANRFGRWCRRNPVVAVLAASLVLALVSGTVVSACLAVRSARHAQTAEHEAQRAEASARTAREEGARATTERVRAERHRAIAEQQVEMVRGSAYNIQLALAREALRADATRAIALLEDSEVCPAQRRDFAWGYLRNLARRDRVVIPGDSRYALDLAFADRGNHLLAVCSDHACRTWDAKTGDLQRVVQVPETFGLHRPRALSEDGNSFAGVVPAGSNKARLALQISVLEDLRRSPLDEETLARATKQLQLLRELAEHNTVGIVDTRTGKIAQGLLGHRETIKALCFSPDGKRVASAGEDRLIKLWDMETGRLQTVLQQDADVAIGLAIAADGTVLASVGADGKVGLWDVKLGSLRKTCQAPPQMETAARQSSKDKKQSLPVVSLNFSPDGKRLALAGMGKGITVWDAQTGLLHSQLKDVSCSLIRFSPDGRSLAIVNDLSLVDLWDSESGRRRERLGGHLAWIHALVFSPDGKYLASASQDRTIRIWHLEMPQEEATLKGHANPVTCVAFSPDGRRLASGCRDGTITLCDVPECRSVVKLEGYSGQVMQVAFSPDGATLASAGTDKSVKLWDVATGQVTAAVGDHNEVISSVAFSPDGATLAFAVRDKTIRRYDLKRRAALRPLALLKNCEQLAISPDGRILAAGEAEAIVVWDWRAERVVARLTGHTKAVRRLVFSPDGETLISPGIDATIRIWDLATGQPRRTAKVFIGDFAEWVGVASLALTPDGKTLASSALEPSIRLWDAKSLQERVNLEGHGDKVSCVAFSPDGRRLASGCWDGTIKLWHAAGTEDQPPVGTRSQWWKVDRSR